MIDFKKILEEQQSEEYQQREKEQEERERIEKELRNQTAHFTGHRPQHKSMFGFDLKHPGYKPIIDKLTEVIEMVINKKGITRFISGGALGIDTIAFWCVHKLKDKYPHIKNIVAVPFKNQPIKWSEKDIKWYYKMLEKADKVIYVDELDEYRINDVPIGEYHVAKMMKRNQYMIDKSKVTIAYWDGSKGGTANTFKEANKIGRMLIRIDPRYNYEVDIRCGTRI